MQCGSSSGLVLGESSAEEAFDKCLASWLSQTTIGILLPYVANLLANQVMAADESPVGPPQWVSEEAGGELTSGREKIELETDDDAHARRRHEFLVNYNSSNVQGRPRPRPRPRPPPGGESSLNGKEEEGHRGFNGSRTVARELLRQVGDGEARQRRILVQSDHETGKYESLELAEVGKKFVVPSARFSSYGESSMLNATDDDLSHHVRPTSLEAAEELGSGFEKTATHLNVGRLKGKLDSDGDDDGGGRVGIRKFLLHRGGPNVEALGFGPRSLVSSSPPPSSMEGLLLPLGGAPADIGLDAELLHAETRLRLQASRSNMEELQQQQQQQGTTCLQSRTDMHRLRFPEKTPDKLHRKRAKTHSNLSLRQQTPTGMSRVSGLSANSSTRSSGMSEGADRRSFPSVPPPVLPANPAQGGQEPMDSDSVGNEDGDGGRGNDALGEQDNEARMDLTDDLLHKVFSFLEDIDLCRAAKVCRQWRAASAHEDFWKSLNFESRQVSHDQVTILCQRYPKATELNLRGCPCVDEVLVQEAMLSLRNLEILTLGHGFLSDGFFYLLAGCESLQSLSITDATLGSGGAQEIQLRHESLRSLQIVKCRVLRIAIRCPQLETLSLNRTGTASAMLHCPRLVSLDVSSCHKLSDAGVRAAATACPLLASLDMSYCAYVSDETLREISLACNLLRSLDASHCPNISLEGVRMPMLMDLKLKSCEGINSSSMAALSHCVMLEVLHMDHCWLLTAVTLDLPRLRSISLGNNRKFVELTLRTPALTLLDLSQCPALSRIDIASSSLEKLSLRQQLGLSSMALQCPWLREVDLTECEALTDSVCDVFSEGGGCPKLNSLTLDNCEGLEKVSLSTISLRSLSLNGCRNVVSLKLSCPSLQCLRLDGCNRLIAASFAPVGLTSLNLGICPHLTSLEVEAAQMTLLDLRGCGVLYQASIRCPHLSSLDASYCSQFGDDCLAATTAACPAIQSLVLASCPAVGPVGLLALKELPHLTVLDLSYTFLTDLSPIFEACPHLKVLRLQACKYLRETALNALHGGKVLAELEQLDMSYGSLGRVAIEGVLALCPHLKEVRLNGCAHVTDHLWSRLANPPSAVDYIISEDAGMVDVTSLDGSLDRHSPMDAVYPQSISTSEVLQDIMSIPEKEMIGNQREGQWQGASTHNFHVQTPEVTADPLSSSRSDGLEIEHSVCIPRTGGSHQQVFTSTQSEMTGSVRALQTLLCVGCPNIQTVVIQRDAACLHLHYLNLSLSVNIREVRLGCENLTYLNLSQCRSLVVLELNCPRLVTLLLQACGIEAEMLEQAICGCSVLETLDVRNCSKVPVGALARMRSICPGVKRLYNTSSI